ncbi:MAG: SDR family NAD(P)-dependent oxidoreductase, partial [Nanoarchaeota archaeon]
MKTVLITGGAGFIGSHLCDFLIDKGFRVICVDNLITGNKKNIGHLKEGKNFKFINHDISRHIAIDEPLDYVLHFASPASPVDYQKIP